MKKGNFLISYLSYILVFATTVFWAAFYQQTFFFLLVILEICLPFFSFFLTKYCFYRLKPSVVIKPSSTTKGESAQLLLKLHNPTRLPLSSAIATFSFHSLFYGEKEETSHILPLKAHCDNALTFSIRLTKCGIYETSLSQIQGFDFLHLFRFQKDLDITSHIRVLPDSLPKEERHEALYSEGFDEFEESGRTGNVSSNVTDIREYRPGDRLQKIHWKLSSKIDKWMVKENEATSTNEFFLLMELFQPPKAACKEMPGLGNALDTAIEEAWAVSLELLQAGEIFVFAVYSSSKEDFDMSTIRSREDLENAFSQCFYEPAYDTENLALDIYEKSGLKKGTLLHVTHKGVQDVPA